MCKDYTERKWDKDKRQRETVIIRPCNSHNRVETEREIPKLKFIVYRNVKRSIQVNKQEGIAVEVHFLYYILQEFQYGTEAVRFTLHKLM